MSGFTPDLTSLAGVLESQFNAGENTKNALDVIDSGGGVKPYGTLGEFSSKFDQSQERRYLERGYLRTDSLIVNPRQLEISTQEPSATVLVKKRAFSSVAENFYQNSLDKDERLFIKATKVLFQNKAIEIASYEKLFKAQKLILENSEITKLLLPIIVSIVDGIWDFSSKGQDSNSFLGKVSDVYSDRKDLSQDLKKLKGVTDKIKSLYAFKPSNFYTTWISNTTAPFKSSFGEGTGVIELANISNISVNNSLQLRGSGGSISFSDPYNLMYISSNDIERAIADSTNVFYNSKMFNFGRDNLQKTIEDLRQQLNDKRLSRGVGSINFFVNKNTVFGKRVRAVIESTGDEIPFEYKFEYAASGAFGLEGKVSIPNEYLINGSVAGVHGLDDSKGRVNLTSELNLFYQIIDMTFDLIKLESNAISNVKINNEKTNYVRRKLRLHYLGKSIVQPMDQVHIYISSKKRVDNKILGGMKSSFKSLDFKQSLNNQASDLYGNLKSLFTPSSDAYGQIEKSVFVGKDFPDSLWYLLRHEFINDNDGTHVFGGLVSTSSSTLVGSGSSYNVSVTLQSMSSYLSQGRLNFKPAVDVFNGEILDPLTIFKTSIDSISGSLDKGVPELLDENKEIINSGYLRYNSGNNANRVVTETNLVSDRELGFSGEKKKVIYEPDGLVHKWKEGIGTLVKDSNTYSNNSFPQPVSIQSDPFAKQDIMNIISILVTGMPYNFVTYYKAGLEAGTVAISEGSNVESIQSQLLSIRSGISKNNKIWGNFIPFKNLIVTDEEVIKTINAQNSISKNNQEISSLIESISQIQNKVNLFYSITKDGQISPQQKSNVDRLLSEMDGKVQKLKTIQDEWVKSVNSNFSELTIIGNDVSYDTSSFVEENIKSLNPAEHPAVKKKIRRRINFLTRRLARDVRANEDKNFFIVDDTYDKDYDLWVFGSRIGDLSLFNSEYLNSLEKISTLGNFLDLEIFCDSQGNIRVRSPQYNKMPSSVFQRLVRLKKNYGIQLYPKFLESLIYDQLQFSLKSISTIEDKIRLDCAAMKCFDDASAELFINSANTTGNDRLFKFISQSNGKISNIDNIIKNDNFSKQADIYKDLQSSLDGQLKVTKVFNLYEPQTTNLILNSVFEVFGKNVSLSEIYYKDYVKNIINRLVVSTGQKISENEFVSSNSSSDSKISDPVKVYNNISKNLIERQRLIKMAAKNIKNAVESFSIDTAATENSLIMPDLSREGDIPELFENLIEDETFDDLGPNSGSRYIIKDSDIKSLSITESSPAYTSIQVNGRISDWDNVRAPDGLNASFSAGSESGNALVTGFAVDYDLWRMYGFKGTQSVSAPFLTDPQSQCAPYAVTLLNQVKAGIFTGTLTIVGNEYMQLGDVIYLEGKDLLFYVTAITHSFSYGGKNFSTSLQLSYGHPPGEYIPNRLDTIGKILYKNREDGSYVLRRQSSSFNERAVGAIYVNADNSFGQKKNTTGDNTLSGLKSNKDIDMRIFSGPCGELNKKTLEDISYNVYLSYIQNNDPNNNAVIEVQLRTYCIADENNSNNIKTNESLKAAAERIVEILKNPDAISDVVSNQYYKRISSAAVIVDDKYNKKGEFSNVKVHVTPVINMKDKSQTKSPSSVCYDLANKIEISGGFGGTLDKIITNNIIDCWVIVNYEPRSNNN